MLVTGLFLRIGNELHPNWQGQTLLFRLLIEELGLWNHDTPMTDLSMDRQVVKDVANRSVSLSFAPNSSLSIDGLTWNKEYEIILKGWSIAEAKILKFTVDAELNEEFESADIFDLYKRSGYFLDTDGEIELDGIYGIVYSVGGNKRVLFCNSDILMDRALMKVNGCMQREMQI